MSWKGEPGPRCASTELALLGELIAELEQQERSGERINMEDGQNHRTTVDAYVLMQALWALRNYETLLRQPLNELIAPYFFHTGRMNKELDSLR